MIKRRGFTLTELMIALTVLGVLTALVLPMLNENSPSRNRMMVKKAYNTIENVVHDLINNEQYYPELGSDGKTYVGFDNMLNACGEKPEDSTEGSNTEGAQLDGSCQGLYKFPKLFAWQLNTSENPSDKGSNLNALIEEFKEKNGRDPDNIEIGLMKIVSTTSIDFVTSDGIYWLIDDAYMPFLELTNVVPDYLGRYHAITVDVNGDKKPNCFQGAGSSCPDRTKDFDQFKVYVLDNGKIVPAAGQTWFENAISIDSSINGD